MNRSEGMSKLTNLFEEGLAGDTLFELGSDYVEFTSFNPAIHGLE